jgi:hypothetical protein
MSAKNVARFDARLENCPRCLWLGMQVLFRSLYGIMPGVFSSIDARTKRVVHGHFDRYGVALPWLAPVGPVVAYREPPHWSKFQKLYPEYGILLTGAPDGVLLTDAGDLIIVDYKTARYTATQDSLFPLYEGQLNGYAEIAEHLGMGRLSRLALVNAEPGIVVDPDDLIPGGIRSCCRSRSTSSRSSAAGTAAAAARPRPRVRRHAGTAGRPPRVPRVRTAGHPIGPFPGIPGAAPPPRGGATPHDQRRRQRRPI